MLVKSVVALGLRPSSLLVAALTPIPVDISSVDGPYIPRALSTAPLLEPVTTIVQLEGAGNLGTLLWGFVLYQGFFTTAGRPADWLLPLVAKGLNSEGEQWFQDYKDGFKFTVPPAAELVRVLFFFTLGYYTNAYIIQAFDNDPYWGWAISGSLFIPVGLLALARNVEKRETRDESVLADQMRRDFKEFADSRITRHRPSSPRPSEEYVSEKNRPTKRIIETPERVLVTSFRRAYERYRDESIISDKAVRRVVRGWVGYKPTSEGVYLYIELQNLRKESRDALANNLQKARELRRAFQLENAKASVSGSASSVTPDEGSQSDDEDEARGGGGTFRDFVRPGPSKE